MLFCCNSHSSCCALSASNIFSCSVYVFSLVVVVFSFFICDSNLSPYSSFDFLPVVFRGTQMFLETNFAPAYIKSFNSVMLSVGIFVKRRSLPRFRIGQSSSLGSFSLFLHSFFLLGSVFFHQCISPYHFVFGLEFLIFLYLPSWLVAYSYICLYICRWISSFFKGQKTNHSLLLFLHGQEAFGFLYIANFVQISVIFSINSFLLYS